MTDTYNALAADFTHRLLHTPAALGWLEGRLGGRVDGVVERFGLGVSPPQWSPGYFANRLTLPLWHQAEVWGFRGRTFQPWDAERPKAVPWPAQCQRLAQPLGIGPTTADDLDRQGFAVLVEGEIDCLAVWSAGVPAIGVCMAQLTQAAAVAIAETVDAVLIWADYDLPRVTQQGQVVFAGRAGAEKSAELLRRFGVQTVIGSTDDFAVKDAGDLLAARGPAAIRRFVIDHLAALG